MKRIEIKAPAKINIGLNIVSKRDDGYHNLETFFYPIHDLYDYITFEKADKFSFTCADASLENESNLIVKALRILEDIKKTHFNIAIHCEKHIPMGAGLGGGSSDAAAALISLNELYQLNLKYEELVTISLLIGSDVPFFLKSKPAIGRGRGEILTHVDLEINKFILLINPNIHISTKEAFSRIKPEPSNIDYSKYFTPASFQSGIKSGNIRNDFEASVFEFHPEIKELKERLIANGAEFALMSGSGSTVYALFSSSEEAIIARDLLPDGYFKFISRPDSYFH